MKIWILIDGDSVDYLKCGHITGTYPTIDFGVNDNVSVSFENQRAYAKMGPLVNKKSINLFSFCSFF